MASDLQHKTLALTVETGRAGKKIVKRQILKKVGYSQAVADQPHKVFESKGFLELCDENGLTEDFLTKALYDDIKHKPKKREKELRLAFQVRGKLNDKDGNGNTNNFFFITQEQQARIARRVVAGGKQSESAPS